MNEIRWTRAAAIVLAVGMIATARGDGDAKATARRDLPGGGSVELLGVSLAPSGPKTWWGPDGRLLDRPPYDRSGASARPGEGHKVRVFAARVAGPPGQGDVSVRWNISGASTLGVTHPPPFVGRAPVPGIHGAVATVPADAATCTVRIGVTGGEWKVEATGDGRGMSAAGTEQGAVLFATPRAIANGTSLAVAHGFNDREVRVVAVDVDGKVQAATSAGGVSAGAGSGLARLVSTPLHLLDLEFSLPLDRIREFRFQTRSLHWAEFRDVPLEPRPGTGGP